MGRYGKIERLPTSLRNEVGERVLNKQSYSEIAPWINTHPVAQARWELHFPDNPKLEDHNLSDWIRNGGFKQWKEEWAVRELSARCFGIAKAAGTNITDGAAALLGGQILAGIEQLASEPMSDEDIDDSEDAPTRKVKGREDKLVAYAMALKMTAEAQALPVNTKLKVDGAKLAQQKADLETKKFQRQTAELFIKFIDDENAKAIALGKAGKDNKIAQLIPILFGAEPEGMGPKLD